MAVLQLADVVKASNGIVLTRLYDGSREAYVNVELIADTLEQQLNLGGQLRAALTQLVTAAETEATTTAPVTLAAGPSLPARR